MRTLEFIVKKQKLMKKSGCDFTHIVAGSRDYLRAKFYFSSDWDNCKKAASFWIDDKEYAVLLDDDDSCVIPFEVLTNRLIEISVTGAKDKGFIPTTKITVRQEVR